MSDRCGYVDPVSGAVCTLTSLDHSVHIDESDWGCILTFPTIPELILSGGYDAKEQECSQANDEASVVLPDNGGTKKRLRKAGVSKGGKGKSGGSKRVAG